MEFLIERAVLEDYQIVADMIQSVWQQIQQKDWFVADDSEYTCHTLKEGNGIGYKAFEADSGALAGVFIAALPGSGEENLGRDIGLSEEELGKVAHMESVAILPGYRGNGLQYSLMKTAEEELLKQGYRYLMCTVHPENRYSKNNMIKQGYEVVLTKEKYGGYLRDILLKKLS
ncbi:GNAT family N-acetyltransferase [Lacrimispora sp.]|jgi:ribosomal protein S18 acetylase RimI-like enzyme|uniref:GNAT family N-acetyltransferase n=1 Tax=Lacrimispora sp. TaxID=2719234 RepID=UPI00289BEE1E|nr:GNAT family N-acetyltransferase [Lacrimispora sp.]